MTAHRHNARGIKLGLLKRRSRNAIYNFGFWIEVFPVFKPSADKAAVDALILFIPFFEIRYNVIHFTFIKWNEWKKLQSITK